MTVMSSCWGTNVSDVFVEQDRGSTNHCIVLSKHFVLAGRADSIFFTFLPGAMNEVRLCR